MHRKMPVRFGKGRIPLEFAYFIHLTMDTLVLSYVLGTIYPHSGLSPVRLRPCWAHMQKAVKTLAVLTAHFIFQQYYLHIAYSHGGGEENRTPVRKHCLIGFSECFLYFEIHIVDAHKQASRILSRYISQSSLRELAIRYPAN